MSSSRQSPTFAISSVLSITAATCGRGRGWRRPQAQQRAWGRQCVHLAGWLAGRLGWLAGWAARLAGWLGGWLAGWLGWPASWLAGRLASWLARLGDRLSRPVQP
eukprot:364534-Chlamydomonas_euryale.AAC.1